MIVEVEDDVDNDEHVYPYVSEHVVCVLHRVCSARKIKEGSQHHNLFRTIGKVMGKTIDIIIDNGSTSNLILKRQQKLFQLHMEKHPSPHQLGWIKNKDVIKISQTCVVPLSKGKIYAEKITCDALEIDATHDFGASMAI